MARTPYAEAVLPRGAHPLDDAKVPPYLNLSSSRIVQAAARSRWRTETVAYMQIIGRRRRCTPTLLHTWLIDVRQGCHCGVSLLAAM